MKPLTLAPGQDSSNSLTPFERKVINDFCGQVIGWWQASEKPIDVVDLMVVLNQGAARVMRKIREAGLSDA